MYGLFGLSSAVEEIYPFLQPYLFEVGFPKNRAGVAAWVEFTHRRFQSSEIASITMCKNLNKPEVKIHCEQVGPIRTPEFL